MKGLARNYVCWPGMDAMLEDRVKGCAQCQESRKSPAKAPLYPRKGLNVPGPGCMLTLQDLLKVICS